MAAGAAALIVDQLIEFTRIPRPWDDPVMACAYGNGPVITRPIAARDFPVKLIRHFL